MNNLKLKKVMTKLLLSFVSISIIILTVVLEIHSYEINIIIGIYALMLSTYLIIKNKNSLMKVMIYGFIAYCNYSILYGRYINPEISIINAGLTNLHIDAIGINVLQVFVTILILFDRTENLNFEKTEKMNKSFIDNKRFSWILVYSSIFFIIFIALHSYDLRSMSRATYSPLYEYSIVFFILGFFFSGNKKKISTRILLVLSLLYILMDLLGGNRITAVQLIIVVLIFFFSDRLSLTKIVFLGFLGLILMNVIAIYRTTFNSDSSILKYGIDGLLNNMFAFSTAYFAYFASLTFIAVKPIYPLIERIFQFKDFLVSQFVLGTVGESLDAISLRHYYHAHGGVLPIYLYYYLGWLGVSISGIVVGLYLRFMSLTKHKKSELKNIVAIYITSTVPRWYLYSPNQLIRGVMIMSLMYLAYSFIYSITQKRKVLMILNSK